MALKEDLIHSLRNIKEVSNTIIINPRNNNINYNKILMNYIMNMRNIVQAQDTVIPYCMDKIIIKLYF